ncbi:MAG TPA: LON peptidase substrate-binding domain-containing protein [Mycobacteriales bacterium]|nr:LON peptidase substrate-binding domain-containing protein [Mycobacteriales bacterium]
MPELRLFPLETVLFPGQPLTIRVFEERYRALVDELLTLPAGPERRFGVVAIRLGTQVGADGIQALHSVGCVAEICDLAPERGGHCTLTTMGRARFRLHEVDQTLPYLTGTVSWLAESVGEPAAATSLAQRVSTRYRDYLVAVAAAQGGAIDVPELPADPLVLSYLVAATTVLDLLEHQRLLDAADAVSRLRTELQVLSRECALLHRLGSVPARNLGQLPMAPN